MTHPVVQFQIISKTPDETARFYSDLFGWAIDADNPMGYRRIDTGSKEGISLSYFYMLTGSSGLVKPDRMVIG